MTGLPDPYYSDDHVTIYHGDCLDLPYDMVTDVLVTDPPYGITQGVKGPRRDGTTKLVTNSPPGAIDGDHDTTRRDAMLARWGPGRPALVFGSWKAQRPPGIRARLLWLKAATIPCLGYTPWSPADEEIYVLGQGWGSPSCLNYILTSEARAGNGGLAAKTGHPTPKPIALMRALLDNCPPGVIFDPFMGSGATLRAAKDLGRKAIGIEIKEEYCEIAARRCAQEVLPL
ncbi:MAG: site-specific DNA-methyltransferase [Actinomycetia bacterium]|nr:site-specific DNA-methyltransferase [Actinomycetes bacterium]